jgi:hypothetical protein
MRIDSSLTRDDLLRQLEREAERTWGADRLQALRPALVATADALWHVAQQTLDPADFGA